MELEKKKQKVKIILCEIVEYKCSKCRDLRFILKDNEAIPCTCKALREDT